MDNHIPREQRMKRVEEVLQQLGLSEARDTLIGIPGRIKGISGGETKRLAFACEVLTNPALMFCDEPTTGLDSFMAQTIVFALFDRVLLLAEGRLAFLGLTSDGLKFFSRLGKTCPFMYNPADFFISSLAIRPGEEEESEKFLHEACDEFQKSDYMKEIEEAVNNNMGTEKVVEVDEEENTTKIRKTPYKAGWFAQLSALNSRCFLEMAREPMLLRMKLIQSVMVALIVGLIYLNTDGEASYDQASVQNLNGVLFMLVANLSFQFAIGVVNTFCAQLPIFLREHGNGMYRTDTFYLTKNIAEIPSSIIMPFIFLLVCYFMVNLHRSVETFFLIVVALIFVSNAALSYGK
ncbi:Protein white [Armadillidium nasatum]|uniref:Protein white n=1 Tax=Armadillidium nasatum TaxID=96803 RepID=A0A5N5STM7_9CRUS|nr:Protein white [Armadillidium nasatum]